MLNRGGAKTPPVGSNPTPSASWIRRELPIRQFPQDCALTEFSPVLSQPSGVGDELLALHEDRCTLVSGA